MKINHFYHLEKLFFTSYKRISSPQNRFVQFSECGKGEEDSFTGTITRPKESSLNEGGRRQKSIHLHQVLQ